MQHDTWIEDCYVDSNGIWQQNYRPAQLVEEKMEKMVSQRRRPSTFFGSTKNSNGLNRLKSP